MAGTFSDSFQLVKESFAVLKKDKELVWFSVISLIAAILMSGFFIFFTYSLANTEVENTKNGYLYYVFLFAYYLLSYFIIIFLNTGLITCANKRLNGGDPTLSDGFLNAKKHIGKIFVWALISATVGIILGMATNNRRGRIVGSVIGMAWNLLTFFVIPIMIFENKSVIQSIKKSGSLFKKTWGKNVISRFSMGIFFWVLSFAGAILLMISFSTASSAIIIPVSALAVIYFVVLAIISLSLNGIFVATLYIYATTGEVPRVYSHEIIENAFQPKGY